MKFRPVIDKNFQPCVLAIREFEENVKKEKECQNVKICLERSKGKNYIYSIKTFLDNTGHDEENYRIVERIVKTCLWIAGGYKIYISGSKKIYEQLARDYSKDGARAFDYDFMSTVFKAPMEVIFADDKNFPSLNEEKIPVQNNLNGCRIGFDAGGSDRKVSAVIEGEAVFSDETVWYPKTQTDPEYHYEGILDSCLRAAEHLPHVDAIGVSTAGIVVDNELRIASLYYSVPKDKLGEKSDKVYKRVAETLSKKEGKEIPLIVANDGDVTALAGSMDLHDDCVLGIAMGTSEAAGYIGDGSCMYGWFNELAFVPVDFNKDAMVDEWSGDIGCGVKYFSQDSVIKLAEMAGIVFPTDADAPAKKLKYIQGLNNEGNKVANQIFEDIGVYMAYTIAYYAMFYDIKHILLLGRVVSGKGGETILEKARDVLATEFSELSNILLHMPDEKSRRVGQSIAAASLPVVK